AATIAAVAGDFVDRQLAVQLAERKFSSQNRQSDPMPPVLIRLQAGALVVEGDPFLGSRREADPRTGRTPCGAAGSKSSRGHHPRIVVNRRENTVASIRSSGSL